MEFHFSKEAKKKIDEILKKYPDKNASLLPVLELAQKEAGYLSVEVLKEVSKVLNIPAVNVISTATFYTMFNKKPVGKYHIQVCHNISCYLRGSENILKFIKDYLKIDTGETSSDGMFTLSEVECLAACGNAPVIQINEKYYENLTVKKVKEILDNLKNGEGKNGK